MSTFKQGDQVRVSPSPLASVRHPAAQPATVLAVRPGAYVVRLDTHAEPFRTLVSAAQVGPEPSVASGTPNGASREVSAL